MEPAQRELLTETLLVAPQIGPDDYGVHTYGTAVAYPCRIHRRMLTLFTGSGRQLVPETKIYLDGDAVVSEQSQITLPDGTTPPIQRLRVSKDDRGAIDHYIVYL